MTTHPALRAEPTLIKTLQRIDGTAQFGAEITQQRADEMLARIAWSRLAEPGDGAAGTMLRAFGAGQALAYLLRGCSPTALCADLRAAGHELPARTVKEALERWRPRLNRAATVADIERAAAQGMRIVLPNDPAWPAALADLEAHQPIMLWAKGNPALLATTSLGVVGARAATGYGQFITAEIVDGVCAADVTIVSGAAYGVDVIAHRTALAAETPTIAVVAGGADCPYPRAHTSLLERIGEVGLVCTEMVPGSAPTKWRFLMRNRLIAALSRATLVTEAGINSGSINTAGHAAQLSRPIGAVPGPINSAASAGCHKLIRDYAATLVRNSGDALELLGLNSELPLFNDSEGDERDGAWERRVLDALPLRGSRDVDDVARRSGLTLQQVRGVLAELELLGRVQRRDSSDGMAAQWALVRETR